MRLMKKYDPVVLRKKFGRYRIWFWIAAGVFFAALMGEILLWGSGGRSVLSFQKEPAAFASFLLFREGGFCLLLCLLGVTLYAPALHIVLPLLRGALAGFAFSALFSGSDLSASAILLAVLYTLLSTQLLFAYSSFCTCVSLHLYTDQSQLSRQNREKELFGGSLFCSRYFCGMVNLRFLFSYSAVLLLVLALLCGLVYAYAFLRGFVL